MENNIVYFKENFFSSGLTDIYSEQKEKVGELDLKSAFSSSIDVRDEKGFTVIKGGFRFFSNKWVMSDRIGHELGIVRAKISLFSKRYVYETRSDEYYITSPSFSRQYEILDDKQKLVAEFNKINGFFESAAYKLTNNSSKLSTPELIAVVMGVNAIRKRHNSNGASATT
ncbi:hypothetical protein [Chengkuizengella axinellae]|uniref:Uncharacterized protein n=1 Tax=Chengkuizengella axinellae TaxID=3064388 RepID=A0ABT9J294_9BACL|nr:hypothetical protein [Chengkuizengella sp. 2205SS18-9]MDP5275740.1 hypothetical protein [Chengkuizengella sp. 2205SS18-9]